MLIALIVSAILSNFFLELCKKISKEIIIPITIKKSVDIEAIVNFFIDFIDEVKVKGWLKGHS